MSYQLEIDPRKAAAAAFISDVRDKILQTLIKERKSKKITQQSIATKLGVNRSVINRELSGSANLTLRRIAELAWTLGYEPVFDLVNDDDGRPNFKALNAESSKRDVKNARPDNHISTHTSAINSNSAIKSWS